MKKNAVSYAVLLYEYGKPPKFWTGLADHGWSENYSCAEKYLTERSASRARDHAYFFSDNRVTIYVVRNYGLEYQDVVWR